MSPADAKNENLLFDSSGWLVPQSGYRVFSSKPSSYYKFPESNSNSLDRISSLYTWGKVSSPIDVSTPLTQLYERILEDSVLGGICNGIAYPFYLPGHDFEALSLGDAVSDVIFPRLKMEFEGLFPGSHFDVKSQGEVAIKDCISPYPGSGQDELMSCLERGEGIFGWTFPGALMGYSIRSQRAAFDELNTKSRLARSHLALTGPIDMGAALLSSPSMLIDPNHYSPVICLSGVQHQDARYCLTFKAYGPHLEFWIMPNQLMPGVEQVSEQWTGAITFFSTIAGFK